MSESPLQNARILLGVTGGIAAYKAVELCRMMQKAGAEVQAIMTRAATEFVRPLTFETLTGRTAYIEMFEKQRAMEVEHIAYARWGDALVIAPATANTLAKMAHGLADDALSTTALAFRGPVVAAPAMNTAMWEHPQTVDNLAALRARGIALVSPGAGMLACGEKGAGRLADLPDIFTAVEKALACVSEAGDLSGKRVLITAGPTVEPIDPVRHLSNRSSGRMGFALADAARRRGAQVTLVAGPTTVEPPERLGEVVRVGTAREMCDAVLERLGDQDICVFSAAVADYTPEKAAPGKIKKEKGADAMELRLVRTPDIAARANEARREGQVFIGFAAETEDLEANARDKMERKGFDVVVGNEVSAENPAFASGDNAVTLFARSGAVHRLGKAPKTELAAPIWDFVIENTKP